MPAGWVTGYELVPIEDVKYSLDYQHLKLDANVISSAAVIACE